MAGTEDAFVRFRDGMTAGHEAARSHDLLFAAGWLIGFVWGAIATLPRPVERRPFERARVA
jgi:hypothetical protein